MSIRNDDEVLHSCAWCGAGIGDDQEVIPVSAGFRDGSDYKDADGEKISLDLPEAGKTVVGIAPPFYSEARQEGHDLMFMLCGTDCAEALEDALASELADQIKVVDLL